MASAGDSLYFLPAMAKQDILPAVSIRLHKMYTTNAVAAHNARLIVNTSQFLSKPEDSPSPCRQRVWLTLQVSNTLPIKGTIKIVAPTPIIIILSAKDAAYQAVWNSKLK